MGIPFSVALMAILLAHEFGHFLLCEKYGVNATLPFFIPAPTLIGTMGAFIRIKSPIRSRRALFDIGVAGPIAGFVVAVPLLFRRVGAVKATGAASREWRAWASASLPSSISRTGFCRQIIGERRSAESTGAASHRGGSLGRNVRHRLEPASRRPTRWRTHHLRGCASSPQMGEPRLGGSSRPSLELLDWMAGVGCDSRRYRLAPSTGTTVAGTGRTRRKMSLVPLILLVLTIVPAPILGQGWF